MKKATKICSVFYEVDISHLVKTMGDIVDSLDFKSSLIFIGRKKPGLSNYFIKKGHEVYFIKYESKRNLPYAIWKAYKLLKLIKPYIIHTHLFEANIIGLTAAFLAKVPKRVHTRHIGNENHVYSNFGKYYHRYINLISHHIIAISDVVSEILEKDENVNNDKIHVVPHGFDLEAIKCDPGNKAVLRKKYGLEDHYPIIGSISRFIHWKGVQYTIEAFEKLLLDFPNAKLVLANANGPYKVQIEKKLEKIPKRNFVTIPFEKKIFDLYPTFNVFVHVPINRVSEAFGMVYVEPLQLGVPSVFTISGIAANFIEDKKNALVVPYQNSDAIYSAVSEIVENESTRKMITSEHSKTSISEFSQERFKIRIGQFYEKIIS